MDGEGWKELVLSLKPPSHGELFLSSNHLAPGLAGFSGRRPKGLRDELRLCTRGQVTRFIGTLAVWEHPTLNPIHVGSK